MIRSSAAAAMIMRLETQVMIPSLVDQEMTSSSEKRAMTTSGVTPEMIL